VQYRRFQADIRSLSSFQYNTGGTSEFDTGSGNGTLGCPKKAMRPPAWSTS